MITRIKLGNLIKCRLKLKAKETLHCKRVNISFFRTIKNIQTLIFWAFTFDSRNRLSRPQTMTLDPRHATLDMKPSTLDLWPSTCDPRLATLDPRLATLNPRLLTLDPGLLTLDNYPNSPLMGYTAVQYTDCYSEPMSPRLLNSIFSGICRQNQPRTQALHCFYRDQRQLIIQAPMGVRSTRNKGSYNCQSRVGLAPLRAWH